jgi:hypothetical protein
MKCPECDSDNVQLTQFIEDPPIDIPCKTEGYADEVHCLDCMGVFVPDKLKKVWIKSHLADVPIEGNIDDADTLRQLLEKKLESLDDDD